MFKIYFTFGSKCVLKGNQLKMENVQWNKVIKPIIRNCVWID